MRLRGPPPDPSPDWAYFFDIDGTLVRIAGSPRGVRVDNELRHLVRGLRALTGGAVAFITGRRVADVDRLFPGFALAVAGQHGAERRGADGRLVRRSRATRQFDVVRAQLAAAAARHAGLLLEDKGLSLALHYRRAPQLASYAHRLVKAAVATLGARYCLLAGNRVVEIRPSGEDKGTAIAAFMRERPFHGRLPVFLGDDISDEYGFAMINRLAGHSVKIGAGASVARWRLRDAVAVRTWMRRAQRSAGIAS